jgi:hypothetical protein
VRLSCVTCADEPDPGQVAWATVHSSEREFEHERFAVWPCPRCRCIHACGDVDLDGYYRRYGLHETGLDLLERVCCRNKLRFIRRFVPLDRGGPVLDFGCGNGIFVEYLRRAASSTSRPRRPPYRPGAGGNGPPGAPAALPPAPAHDGLARTHRPTSIPGSRSSTCRRSTGTWTGTAGWSPSNEPFRWSSLLQPGFWYRGSPAGSSPGPTRSSSSSGVAAEAGPAGTAERRRTAGWSAVRYRQERCT